LLKRNLPFPFRHRENVPIPNLPLEITDKPHQTSYSDSSVLRYARGGVEVAPLEIFDNTRASHSALQVTRRIPGGNRAVSTVYRAEVVDFMQSQGEGVYTV
jgi:hypothetical protein